MTTQHEAEFLIVADGQEVRVGDAVSAEKDGVITEGDVYALQPYGHSEVDPTWREQGTVIIKDCETGHLSHWRPSLVTRL